MARPVPCRSRMTYQGRSRQGLGASSLCLLVGLLWLTASASRADVASNILLNGGFEQDLGATPDNWKLLGNASRQSAHARSDAWSAKVFGNWSGPSNYSLCHQHFPTEPGQVWRGEGWAAHFTDDTLQGGNRAFLQISFLDAQSNYIFGTPSPKQLHAASPTNEWIPMAVEARASRFAAYACLNTAFLQPASDVGAAWFDDCTFGPAMTATLHFAGRDWVVNQGSFDWFNIENVIVMSTNCVWVDTNGWLHLAVRNLDNKWWCAQVESTGWYGYGEYRWTTRGRIDRLDTNAILGLFSYDDPFTNGSNEIDIEWTYAIGSGTNGNVHYTIQPWQIASNGMGFEVELTNDVTTHRFSWTPGEVNFMSYYGEGSEPAGPGDVFAQRRFISSGVPAPEERVIMNLWLSLGRDPTDTQNLEAVISDFQFTPFHGWTLYDDFEDGVTGTTWALTGPGSVAETGGRLHVSPAGDWQTAGFISSNEVHWTDRGPVFVFSGLLRTVEVTAASGGEDVRGILSLCSETNNAWLSADAAMVQAAYDADADDMTFSLFTKTNLSSNEGILRFQGSLTNASSLFGSGGGIRVRLCLEGSEYRGEFLDGEGQPLPVQTTLGSPAGPHGFGGGFSHGYWLVGAQNCDTGQGWVVWEETAAGVRIPDPHPSLSCSLSNDAMKLTWPGSFDRAYDVESTTNLLHPFASVCSNLPAAWPNTSFTGSIAGPSALYHRVKVE